MIRTALRLRKLLETPPPAKAEPISDVLMMVQETLISAARKPPAGQRYEIILKWIGLVVVDRLFTVPYEFETSTSHDQCSPQCSESRPGRRKRFAVPMRESSQ